MKKNKPQKAQAEHLMEAFPAPQGMPAEWHEHDIATAKLKLKAQAEKAEKVIETEAKAVTDAEKEAHMMEAFPGLKTEPKHWHCTTCEDEM